MALPKQVQAQADAVAAFEKQVADANKPADEPKPTDPAPTDPNPNEVKNADPVPVDTPKPVEEDAAQWKQRYLSLQGQFNSQVPALQQQVKSLTESVEQLTTKLQEKTVTQQSSEPTELVTTKDVEAFGEDLVDLARRIAKEEFGKRETKYIKQIEALETQLSEAKGQVGEVAQTQAKTATEMFFDALTRAMPTWEQVQVSSECQAWLGTRIPGSTATWNDALQHAAQRRDVSAVLEVFGVFFEKHPALNPTTKADAQQPNAKSELQRQVAPGKSSATAATPQNKRTYSSAEYTAESNRIMRLMQQGKNDDAVRLQSELDAALAENRVYL